MLQFFYTDEYTSEYSEEEDFEDEQLEHRKASESYQSKISFTRADTTPTDESGSDHTATASSSNPGIGEDITTSTPETEPGATSTAAVEEPTAKTAKEVRETNSKI